VRKRPEQAEVDTTLVASGNAPRFLLPCEVNCILSSSVEPTDSWRGPHLIKVRTPVRVADGIVGRRNPVGFPQLNGFLRDTCPEMGGAFFGAFFFSEEMKKERKAVNETSSTATQASICCQKTAHVTSIRFLTGSPETRTIATTHITKLKHKETPSIHFCRKRILTFHKRRIGIAITIEVSVSAGLVDENRSHATHSSDR